MKKIKEMAAIQTTKKQFIQSLHSANTDNICAKILYILQESANNSSDRTLSSYIQWLESLDPSCESTVYSFGQTEYCPTLFYENYNIEKLYISTYILGNQLIEIQRSNLIEIMKNWNQLYAKYDDLILVYSNNKYELSEKPELSSIHFTIEQPDRKQSWKDYLLSFLR